MDIDDAMLRIASLAWQAEDDSPLGALESDENWGRYEGLPPRIELLGDGRLAKLLTPLTYWRPDETHWPVPNGIEVDGASIPQAVWSLTGGPWSGRYRNASIVHDYYCVTKERSWQDTHRMFHDAMRCSKVSRFKAKIMFYAVYRFGPRWSAGRSLEAMDPSEASRLEMGEADAATIAADGEAIFQHNPSLAEIEALADLRNLQERSSSSLEALSVEAEVAQRVRRIVIPGGRGTAEDCEVVAAQAMHLPGFVLDHFERKRVRIIACRDSVTDFETSLRDAVPRGWEETGRSWNDVPGTYLEGHKRVVVATIAQGGHRAVPTSATRLHGSCNLTVHEALHGYDYSNGHSALRDEDFLAAREANFDSLNSYERQAGDAGVEETFAESGAGFFAEPGALQAVAPELFAYWHRKAEAHSELVGGTVGALETKLTSPPLGTAKMEADGTILLALRAEDGKGAIGHGWFRITPDDPSYERLHVRLFQQVALESTTGEAMEVLFFQ